MTAPEVRAGSLAELQASGRLLTKVGTVPVVVFWHDGAALAIEDRCPHLGFPLHQGTVEAGLVTCHWHHARFDLVSGCTLDLWADDARGFDVRVRGDDVFVTARVHADPVAHLQTRLRKGLEDNISLVVAKSVLGLLDAGVPASEIVRTGMEFGARYRGAGWGAGLTVLVAMANLLPHLAPDDQALALVHGLSFVADDTRNQAPRFAIGALETDDVPFERLEGWYRRFVDTRSSDAAERTLETALAESDRLGDVEAMMFAAVTDHVFIDGGHTIDFTNKAFEGVEHLGKDAAGDILPTLVQQTTRRLDPKSSANGVIRMTVPRLRSTRSKRSRCARARTGSSRPVRQRRCARLATPRRRSRSGGVNSARCAARRAPMKNRLAGRSRSPPHFASRGSTCRTTTATGTTFTIPSLPPTDSTTRCNVVLRSISCAARCMQHFGSTSIVSSMCLPRVARRQRAALSKRSHTVSKCRAWSTKRATRRTGSCVEADHAPSWWRH
jgi:nitrite reductase/ring-hydroxylating ferredoxin subunit